MFKTVEITLDGPICSCDERNLNWHVPQNAKGQPFLVISCGTCKTRLEVPNEQFKARFFLHKPYPEEIRRRAEEAKPPPPPPKKNPGDVIDFMSHLKKKQENLPS